MSWRRRKPPSQTWRTFLENHAKDIVSIDFLTVPTVTYKTLLVFVVLSTIAQPSWNCRQLQCARLRSREAEPMLVSTPKDLVCLLTKIASLHHREPLPQAITLSRPQTTLQRTVTVSYGHRCDGTRWG